MYLLSTIVLARYLVATAAVTPEDALAVVQRYARSLDNVSDPIELRRLYLEMAEKIRPVASVLDGVVIERTDEARKLKNIKVWLATVRRRTDPTCFDDVREGRWEVAVTMWLEDLAGALKSLNRVKDRLTGYSAVEKSIPHGRYQIVNTHGYRQEEYADALRLLDSASAKVEAAGFGHAIYGKVVLKSQKGASFAGRYSYDSDVIEMNMGVQHRGSAIQSLVHELGHRVWFKFLSDAQRDAYEDSYFGTAPLSFSLSDRELFWHALEATGWDARATRARLPKELQAGFSEYWADYKRHGVLPGAKNLGISLEMLRKQFVRPKTRHVVLDHKSLSSVSDYGQTNVLEDFAEVFAHHCCKLRLTPDAVERFYEATGKR